MTRNSTIRIRTRKKENRSKETKPEFTHSAIFFFIKPKEDLAGGTTAAKTSPPPCNRSDAAGTRTPEELETPYDRSGAAGTRALEELESNDRLLQENKTKVRIEAGVQQQQNNKTTH